MYALEYPVYLKHHHLAESRPLSSSNRHSLPHDVMASTLMFLGNREDLESFRTATKRSPEIYKRFKKRRTKRFTPLHSLFDGSYEPRLRRYKSIEDLLRNVPTIPEPYLDIKDNQRIQALAERHYRTNQPIMRGLTSKRNLPFLSISLWKNGEPQRSRLMLCVFDADGLANGKFFAYDHRGGGTNVHLTLRDWQIPENFDVHDLINVLNEGRIEADLSDGGVRGRKGVWIIGTRRWFDDLVGTRSCDEMRLLRRCWVYAISVTYFSLIACMQLLKLYVWNPRQRVNDTSFEILWLIGWIPFVYKLSLVDM